MRYRPAGVIFSYIFRTIRRLLIISGLDCAGSIAVGQLIYAQLDAALGDQLRRLRRHALDSARLGPEALLSRQSDFSRSERSPGSQSASSSFPLTFSEARKPRNGSGTTAWPMLRWSERPTPSSTVVRQYLGEADLFPRLQLHSHLSAFKKDRDAFDESQIPERLALALRALAGRPIVFLITHDLVASELAELRRHGIEAARLTAFDKASTDENFYVYRGGSDQRLAELGGERHRFGVGFLCLSIGGL